MARVCEICGKGGMTGHSRSHSNIATKRKQHINIQKTIYKGKTVKACANCLKTQTKQPR